MRKRKEDQQKFVSDSKSSDHLQHPHYRHSKSTHSTSRDRKNQFETQRVNCKILPKEHSQSSYHISSLYRFIAFNI